MILSNNYWAIEHASILLLLDFKTLRTSPIQKYIYKKFTKETELTPIWRAPVPIQNTKKFQNPLTASLEKAIFVFWGHFEWNKSVLLLAECK